MVKTTTMERIKDKFIDQINEKKFLDGHALNEPDYRQEWTDEELEPLRSECCDAPVVNVHGHYICTKCKKGVL
jgi:hypothetical protein